MVAPMCRSSQGGHTTPVVRPPPCLPAAVRSALLLQPRYLAGVAFDLFVLLLFDADLSYRPRRFLTAALSSPPPPPPPLPLLSSPSRLPQQLEMCGGMRQCLSPIVCRKERYSAAYSVCVPKACSSSSACFSWPLGRRGTRGRCVAWERGTC